MRIVLDTNIILAAFSTRSPYRKIIDQLFEKKYELFVVNDILLEYEEKLKEKFNPASAEIFINALTLLSNVHKIETYFQFQLIKQDEDDNKFVDCAIAANADFLVTNDKHFNAAKKSPFPKLTVIDIHTFLGVIEEK